MLERSLSAVLIAMALSSAAAAGEVKVLAPNPLASVLRELGPQYERTSGNTLAVSYGVAAALKRQIDGGEAFDVAILTAPQIEALTKEGKAVPGTGANLVRMGIGVAVRAGAPLPDISTTDAFKRTLLDAKSVAYTTEGASGVYFAKLLERLGIAEQMKPKAKTRAGGPMGELVASGEAELAVQQLPELMTVAGAQVVGPLPADIQNYTVFTAAVGTGAKDPAAAKALIDLLGGPAALPVLKAKGMEPG